MPTESYIQIAPNSTGSRIRNLRLTVLSPDVVDANGQMTPFTVQMQVIALADSDGNILDFKGDTGWQEEMLTELKSIRAGIELLVGASLGD